MGEYPKLVYKEDEDGKPLKAVDKDGKPLSGVHKVVHSADEEKEAHEHFGNKRKKAKEVEEPQHDSHDEGHSDDFEAESKPKKKKK
jgi:hypothetical protein